MIQLIKKEDIQCIAGGSVFGGMSVSTGCASGAVRCDSGCCLLPPACSCLDYNDTEFGGPSVKTMDACWTHCCVSNKEYHAAKFGKYPRDCS